MDIITRILICILISLLVFLVCMIRFVIKFNKKLRYINRKFIWSKSRRESLFWKDELRVIYWSFIPFLTPERVEKLREWMADQQEEEKTEDSIMKMLMPSFLGIALCAVCLAGGTYAWFTASTSTSTQLMKAANYDVTAVVTEKGGNAPIIAKNGLYTLSKNTVYEIALTATGTASTGYCVIKPNVAQGAGVYTQQFSPQNTITVYLGVTEDTQISIQAQWGTSTQNITNGSSTAESVESVYLWVNGKFEKKDNVSELTTYLNNLEAQKNNSTIQQSTPIGNETANAVDVTDNSTSQNNQEQGGTAEVTIPSKNEATVPNDNGNTSTDDVTFGETTKSDDGTEQNQSTTPSDGQGNNPGSEAEQTLE